MGDIRVVDKRGHFLLGKTSAGRRFQVTTLPSGDILLRAVPNIPESERWLHEPEMKATLLPADAWLRDHPPEETDLDQMEATLAK